MKLYERTTLKNAVIGWIGLLVLVLCVSLTIYGFVLSACTSWQVCL